MCPNGAILMVSGASGVSPQALSLEPVRAGPSRASPVAGDLRSSLASEHEKSPGRHARARASAPPSLGAAPRGACRGGPSHLRGAGPRSPGPLATALPAVLARIVHGHPGETRACGSDMAGLLRPDGVKQGYTLFPREIFRRDEEDRRRRCRGHRRGGLTTYPAEKIRGTAGVVRELCGLSGSLP